MRFIIVCIDKDQPEYSEIILATEDPTETDCQLFPTKQNAERWIVADKRECPDAYDYHVIQVG